MPHNNPTQFTPAEVIGAVVPGVDPHDAQERTEDAVDGVATGTPPPIGPSGLFNNARTSLQALGVLSGSAAQPPVFENIRDAIEDARNTNQSGDSGLPQLPDSNGLNVPWLAIGVFVLAIVAVNAVGGGVGEAIAE